MTLEDITTALTQLFGTEIAPMATGLWQVDSTNFRLLILLSDDHSWLRALIPIVPAQEAQPFSEQLLEANFNTTQIARYAIHQNVLWGVFQHSLAGLSSADFKLAIAQLITLQERGLSDCFNQLIESRIRQIIQSAKHQGQSLEATLQTLDRFYQEGIMGDLGATPEDRNRTLAAWQHQLKRLWSEVEE